MIFLLVFEILLRVAEGKSWADAILQTIPPRKGAKLKESAAVEKAEVSQNSSKTQEENKNSPEVEEENKDCPEVAEVQKQIADKQNQVIKDISDEVNKNKDSES